MSYILPLSKIGNFDPQKVGFKAESLLNLNRLGVSIPKGFIITTDAFEDFLDENNLSQLLLSELKKIDIADPVSVQLASEQIKRNILNHHISKKLSKEFFKAYDQLRVKSVAIRISPLKTTILADNKPLYLSVTGEASILELIKHTWADLFSPTNLIKIKNFKKQQTAIIIQEMINADTAGVVHTTDYLHQNKQQMLIEAIWGLGKYIRRVHKPDHYFVDHHSLKIVKKHINRQQLFLHSSYQNTKLDKLSPKYIDRAKISDQQIELLAQVSKKIHRHFFYPQTIEWAFAKNKLWIFQTQNLDDYLDRQDKYFSQKEDYQSELNLDFIASGKGLIPGIVSGKLSTLSNLQTRGIVIVKNIDTEIWQKLPKITGLIIDGKKINYQLRSVLREKGIPTIIDVNHSKSLKIGRIYTIDGRKGEIFRGQPKFNNLKLKSQDQKVKPVRKNQTWQIWANLPTAYDSPFMKTEFADVIAGIKGELLLKDLDFHPQYILNRGQHLKIVKHLEKKLSQILDKFPNKSVVYQISDLTSDFANQFYHGNLHEVAEYNPMLGFRGIYRHLHHLSLFKTELITLANLSQKYSQLNMMLPMIRNYQELKQALNISQKIIKNKSGKLKTWLNLTTPANIINLPSYAKIIRHFQIDMDLLTSFTLGVDPQNSDMLPLFNQADPSILWLLKHALNYARKYNLKVIVKGDILGKHLNYADLVKKYGAMGICISPDLIPTVRGFAKQK